VSVRQVGLALALGLSLAAPSRAAAQTEEEAPIMSWYGYQSLALDGTAFVLSMVGVSKIEWCPFGGPSEACGSDNRAANRYLVGAVLLYGLGGPTVHALHGHWPRAGFSLMARAAPFLAPLLLPQDRAGGFFALGALGAIILDDAFMAHEPAKPLFSVVPTYHPLTRTRGLALAGTF